MKTSLILIFIIALILVGTNPGLEEHRSAVSRKALEAAGTDDGQNEWQRLGSEIGKKIGGALIERMVERNNFILFSLGRITFGEKSKVVSVGVLGNVIVLKDMGDENSDSDDTGAVSTAFFSLSWKKPDLVMEEMRGSFSTLRENLDEFTVLETDPDYVRYFLEMPAQNIIFTDFSDGDGWIAFEIQESVNSIINFYTNLGFKYYEGTYSDYLQSLDDNYCVTVSKDIFNEGKPLKVSFWLGSCEDMMAEE